MACNGLSDKYVEDIIRTLDNHAVAVVTGGAGAGKTHIMVKMLESVSGNYDVCCITYTNAAVKEIKSRINNNKIYVSTIHDFLWNQIKKYPEILLRILKEYFTKDGNTLDDSINSVTYADHKDIGKGIISHDEVIFFSKIMFSNYPMLGRIIKDKYDCFFIDEYQDTFTEVLRILFSIKEKYKKDFEIALFGDRMQSIYDRLDCKVISDVKFDVRYIDIEENRRNPQVVIDIANKIRSDALQQKHSDDETAPNMNGGKIKQGKAIFIYGNSQSGALMDNCPRLQKSKSLKVLELTYKMIAKECGFAMLLNIYSKYHLKEKLTSNKFIDDELTVNRDPLSEYLVYLQYIMDLYNDGDIHSLLNRVDYKICHNRDRALLKNHLEKLLDLRKTTIGEMVDFSSKYKIICKNERLLKFESIYAEFMEEVSVIPYEEFSNLYKFLFGESKFSTMHGVKGKEYDDILIVLDNGGWRDYNFEDMFEYFGKLSALSIPLNNPSQNKCIEKTRQLFYVACTRAKNSLTVYYPKTPSVAFFKGATSLFGEENCISINDK